MKPRTAPATLSKAGTILALALVVTAFVVRSLYAVDLASSMYVKGQPAMRIAARYDEAALGILGGGGVLFPPHPDPSQTGLLARPPGYALFLSLVYRGLGRSFFVAQLVQNGLNALAVLLVILLGVRLAGEAAGLLAGLLMALSPHLAFCSNLLLPDALCPLVLLLGVTSLVLASPGSRAFAGLLLLGGALLGAAAWLRPNMSLTAPLLAVSLAVLLRLRGRKALPLALVPLGAVLAVGPITLRNYVIFREFVPISTNGGITLWEGVADAGGQRYGARRGDKLVIEEEAVRYKNPRYAEWWAAPDGIRRDRDRMRRSFAVISEHPLWYGRAMLRRMKQMLDYWTPPPPEVGRASERAPALATDEEG
ncbi:MAG TPA: hypothetical protein VN083_00385, partial [Vicinamibacteria bacterium]|nr:hypothetical protein [Vicinamibacteria bacterium]